MGGNIGRPVVAKPNPSNDSALFQRNLQCRFFWSGSISLSPGRPHGRTSSSFNWQPFFRRRKM